MLGSIFKVLDLNRNNGLAENLIENASVYQQQFFHMVQEKLGVDAVYFLRDADGTPKVPLIYFASMESYDEDKIAELHRLAWNLGEAPLFFIVTPDLLLVYNNYVAPRKKDGKLDSEAGLIDAIKYVRSRTPVTTISQNTSRNWRILARK